jgi:hypothetical protein
VSTAELSIVVTGVIALAGIVSQFWQAIASHQHERKLALEARTQEQRADTYVDLLDYLFRVERIMDLIEPVAPGVALGSGPTAPTEDERRLLAARVAAFATADVRRLTNEWFGEWQLIEVNAGMLSEVPDGPGKANIESAVEEFRGRARAYVTEISDRINAELAKPAREPGLFRRLRSSRRVKKQAGKHVGKRRRQDEPTEWPRRAGRL